MAELGFRTIRRDDRPGRSCSTCSTAIDHWKAKGLDLSRSPAPADGAVRRSATRAAQDHGLDDGARQPAASSWPRPALERGRAGRDRAADRATSTARSGTMLGSEVSRRYGARGLPDGHDPDPLHRLGGPELRRVPAARASRSGSRATPTTTSARGCPAAARRSARRRRHASCPTRTSSSATWRSTARRRARPTSGAWRASASASATAARTPSSRASGDHGCEYMTGGRVVDPRRDGAQLRGRHERRHRLRARRDRRVSLRLCNLAMVELEEISTPRTRRSILRLVRRALPVHAEQAAPTMCCASGRPWRRSS